MNEFDKKAIGWDLNPMHVERSKAVAAGIVARIPLHSGMTALEYGAGTGITSFFLKDSVKEILLMDSSAEMVRIMSEKIISAKTSNLKVLSFDLEKDDYTDNKFDIIIIQMVLHHVQNIKSLISKFHRLLNSGGYLAIADLCTEDGSFHGQGFTGHNGFDPEILSVSLAETGFLDISHEICFTINKQVTESESRQFDVFLLVAKKF